MQITPDNKLSFKSKYPYTTPQKLSAIESRLINSETVYKISDDEKIVYTGKDLKEYVKKELDSMRKLLQRKSPEPQFNKELKIVSMEEAAKILNSLGYTTKKISSMNRQINDNISLQEFSLGVLKQQAIFRKNQLSAKKQMLPPGMENSQELINVSNTIKRWIQEFRTAKQKADPYTR